MHRLCRMWLIVQAATLLPSSGSAQAWASMRLAVRDSVVDAPVRRAFLWLSDRYWAKGSTDGIISADSIVPGKYRLVVGCAVLRNLTPHTFADEEIVIAPGARIVRAINVSAAACDQRPFISLTGTFRGFIQFGFEHSRFVACPGSAMRSSIPAAVSDSTKLVWVAFRDARGNALQRWPTGSDRAGYREWLVEWSGRIVGPDRYGHLGVAEYEAEIDSVFNVRASRIHDCQRSTR
jgi:hypothetical protein